MCDDDDENEENEDEWLRLRKEWQDVTKWLLTDSRVQRLNYDEQEHLIVIIIIII